MTKKGYYNAIYFMKTKKIAEQYNVGNDITIQFFQRDNNVCVSGITEVLELLKKNTDTTKYKISIVPDGTIVMAYEPLIIIRGNYKEFGWLEGQIDSILARGCSIATNASNVLKSANNKKIINMADRGDHYINQVSDGYASATGGIKNLVTNAQLEKVGGMPIGTIPHALIALFDGDIIKAVEAYDQTLSEDGLVALVDYNNDVIGDSLKVAKHFKDKLKAVRVDTSETLVDKSLDDKSENYGTCPNLIKILRKELDDNHFKNIKIIVSSGFTPEKIKYFEDKKTPVDFYGVGSYLLKVWVNVSADIVEVNGKPQAKAGREKYKKLNSNMKNYNF